MMLPSVVVIFFCISLVYCVVGYPNDPNVSLFELDALDDLYHFDDGTNWKWKPENTSGAIWNFTEPDPNPCSSLWQGITCECNNESCFIVELVLSNYGLNGTIPDSIGNLSSLTVLDLSRNVLKDLIPSSIGKLSNLTTLNLEFNKLLTGPIPITFSKLQLLVELQLSGNTLTGSLPKFLFDFAFLEYLGLEENRFVGAISSDIGKLTTLKELDLGINFFTSLPESIENLSNLEVFQISGNLLTGSIPAFIGNITSLVTLDLSRNLFVGGIPSSFSRLSNLTAFNLEHNYALTGPIPEWISNLTQLSVLYLSDNSFTGHISPVYRLHNLKYLLISKNRFIGTISDDIGNLVNLLDIDLSYNSFTSTIPIGIGKCGRLENLRWTYNKMDGAIPQAICNLTRLIAIDLKVNKLIGTIPRCLSQLVNLSYLDLNNNNLTGSIPDSLCLLNRSLTVLSLYSNNLTGSIPPALLNSSTKLLHFNVYSNQLTGTLPNFELPALFSFDIQYNYISGTLHKSLANCTQLTALILAENVMSGSFPSLAGMKRLNSIATTSNQFTGSLPIVNPVLGLISTYTVNDNLFSGSISELVCNTTVQYFDLSNNYLDGTVPDCVFDDRLRYFAVSTNFLSGPIRTQPLSGALQFFDCSYNKFSGRLPSFGGGTTLFNLLFYYTQNNQFTGQIPFANIPYDGGGFDIHVQYMDVSDNQLTGTIPNIVSLAVSLISVAVGGNCLTGTIPSYFCNSSKVLFFDLDGLSTAKACRKPIFPGNKFLTSFTLRNHIAGGIPECLFKLPQVQTLHLSGNGIDFSFPKDFTVSDSLTDLTLSHNKISGTIPEVIQNKQWKNLDLSYNKLGGTLNFVEQDSDSTIVLQVNRLSGVIPSSLLNLKNINILTGNMFGCNLQRDQLPSNDPAISIYQCGSNAFDESVILWCCFGGICVVVGSFMLFSRFYWHRQYVLRFKHLWESLECCWKMTEGSLGAFYFSMVQVCKSMSCLSIGVIVVFLPVYSALKIYYSSVQDQYAWTVSAAYLSGTNPAIVLLVFFLGVVTVLFAVWKRQSTVVVVNNVADNPTASYYQIATLWCTVLINCAVMVVANGGYVYVIVTFDTKVIFFAQIAIAVFKLLWNDYVLREMIELPGRFVKHESILKKNAENLQNSATNLPYLSFIILFNSIVAPCLATAAVDSNCFLNAFIPPSSVSTEFLAVKYNPVCSYNASQYHDSCHPGSSSEEVELSYDPPFTYSYQCSSSILTNYASVYVFMFLIVAFIKPMALYVLYRVYNSITPQHWSYRLVNAVLMHLLKPAKDSDLENEVVLFRKDAFVLRSVSKLAVFATFGVVFPLLTVLICVAFVSEVCVNLLIMGRFLVTIENEEKREQFKERLVQDCKGCVELLLAPLVSLVVPFAAFFYSLFVFDIYGDKVGYRTAIWAPCVLTVYPWLLRVGQRSMECWRNRSGSGSKDGDDGMRVTEMRETELSSTNSILHKSVA